MVGSPKNKLSLTLGFGFFGCRLNSCEARIAELEVAAAASEVLQAELQGAIEAQREQLAEVHNAQCAG